MSRPLGGWAWLSREAVAGCEEESFEMDFFRDAEMLEMDKFQCGGFVKSLGLRQISVSFHKLVRAQGLHNSANILD